MGWADTADLATHSLSCTHTHTHPQTNTVACKFSGAVLTQHSIELIVEGDVLLFKNIVFYKTLTSSPEPLTQTCI